MQRKTKFYVFTIAVLACAAIFANYRYAKIYADRPTPLTPEQINKDYVAIFSQIYAKNIWGGSGVGSNPVDAAPYMALLQQHIDDPRVTTIVDLGCGDWQIMRQIYIPDNKTYYGYDVVPDVIKNNKAHFSKKNVRFYHTMGLKEFSAEKISGDLLIVKDVLQHWPFSEIYYFIENVLPNFKYALITNQYVVKHSSHNKDSKMGPFHSLGLLNNPFNLQHATAVLEYDGPDRKQVLFYVNPNLA